MMNIEELKKYHAMIVEFWDYFRRYSDPESTDEFWRSCTGEASKIRQKYSDVDDELARMLAVAFLSAIQRICRKKQKEAIIDSKRAD